MEMSYPSPEKYQLIKALRPFSYSVALITCGLGIALAGSTGQGDWLRSLLVIMAGVLLQAASNLANDYADLYYWKQRTGRIAQQVIKQIRKNCVLAVVFTFTACVIGIWLAMEVGWPLFLLGVLGVVGGYSYTGKPIQYKTLGLGIPAVFVFTGVLMVAGAYYAVSGEWSNQAVLISIPVSLLSSALLFANEIRDYLEDREAATRTLTVRTGFTRAKIFYALCLFAIYPISFYLYNLGLIISPFFLLPSLIFLWQPLSLLNCQPNDLRLLRLPPVTGQFFLFFGSGFILSVLDY